MSSSRYSSIALFCALALGTSLLLVMFASQPAEAGKGRKRMMALALLSMLQKNQKIIIPFPVPMPIKVYEKKEPYYYPKEEYPTHHYGNFNLFPHLFNLWPPCAGDESYGHGGHHHHHHGLASAHGAGFGGLDGGIHQQQHSLHTPSYNSHSMVNAYDGKVDGGGENEYGGSYASEEASGGYGSEASSKHHEGGGGVSDAYGGSDALGAAAGY